MGNFMFEEKSIEKLIQIIEKINLCDTWRLKNSKIKRFTFRQHYTSGFIERRFEYFLVANLYKNQLIKRMCWQLFLLINHFCYFP